MLQLRNCKQMLCKFGCKSIQILQEYKNYYHILKNAKNIDPNNILYNLNKLYYIIDESI